MALKYTIEKLEDVDEKYRDEYEEKDGKFVLKLDGMPAPKPDQATIDELERYKAKHQEAEKHRKESERKAREAAEAAAKKSGDIEALEKSWLEKHEAGLAEKDKELESYKALVTKMTVGRDTATLAAEIFGEDATLFSHHIKKRLTSEIINGVAVTRVLDEDGKPSAKTLAELKTEISENPKFAKYAIGSRASGGGDISGKGSIVGKKFSELTEKELVTLRREKPHEYDRLKKEAGI